MDQAVKEIITVDVGIPALNEELNIRRMLQSIGTQKQINYHIERIILLSDGSTDKTVQYAKSLKLPNLHIIEHRKRQGLAKAWYDLLHVAKADILVLLDADIELSNENTLAELVKP